MKRNKFLIIASEWFESLSEKKQKEYIANHPDSKFAHKVGTGKQNPAITKSKNKQLDHLEQEGVDTSKNYFGHSSNDTSKINSVAKHSGQKSGSQGASAPRALLEGLATHKSKIKTLEEKRDQLKNRLSSMNTDDKNYSRIKDRIEEVRDQISVLINK